jgi:AcrR family transcriptional regulator
MAGVNRGTKSVDTDKGGTATRVRMPRMARREQILAAATEVFARGGFSATSLDDIAGEASVSRVILYRHFDSKADLYRAVLDRARERLAAAAHGPDFDAASIDGLLAAAAEDPAGFRLLFAYAVREPEFRDEMERFRAEMVALAHRQLSRAIRDRVWARWAAELAPTVAIEAVLAWLDAGQPDPEHAAERIRQAIMGVVEAAGRR